MKIIDIHAHVYPDPIAAKAAKSIRNYYHLGDDMDGTISTLLDRGTAAGVYHYLILPVAVKPDHVHNINNFIQQQVQQYDCFTGFGTVHAAMDNIQDEVQRIEAMGLKGIKIHPDCQRFDIDDPRLFPMYESIQGRLPVMMHLGDEKFDYSHPARLRKVLDNFPKLEVCAAHFGGHTMYETAKEYLSDTNCILDISSTLMFLDKKTAEGYVNHYGAERLAFGTDYPVWDPVREMELFLALDLTDDQKEQIAWKTASRFLNL
jgi:predicted TIM-barrel fold metal-dependent hydrolase